VAEGNDSYGAFLRNHRVAPGELRDTVRPVSTALRTVDTGDPAGPTRPGRCSVEDRVSN